MDRTHYNGKLRARAWFDVENCNRIEPDLIPKLEQGHKIEISTGLYTENRPVQKGSTHNGKRYDAVAENYQPDHVAVLLHTKRPRDGGVRGRLQIQVQGGDALVEDDLLTAVARTGCIAIGLGGGADSPP